MATMSKRNEIITQHADTHTMTHHQSCDMALHFHVFYIFI